jgi:hypothetical protein
MLRARASIVSVVIGFSLALGGCEGKNAGDPCDKFFQNTCKAPLSCVDTSDKKVCAPSCSGGACKDPKLVPQQVSVESGGRTLPAGCYCLPK